MMLNHFLSVLSAHGIEIERADYSHEQIMDPSRLHLLWGMRYRPPIYEEFARLPNVYFLENGWFTQRTGFYLDKTGPNGMSSIRYALSARKDIDTSQVQARIDQLHRTVNVKPVPSGSGYILIPLQVERDTQLLFWSQAAARYPNRQVWLVDQVCRAFPKERIVIRPHPRDPGIATRIKQQCDGFKSHRQAEFATGQTSYDYVAGAKAVVGFNSTVLLEALTFFKPIAAMGTGIFTGNGVMLECDGRPALIPDILRYLPDANQIRKFLALLFERQIPYDLPSDHIDRFPVLQEAIRQCSPT